MANVISVPPDIESSVNLRKAGKPFTNVTGQFYSQLRADVKPVRAPGEARCVSHLARRGCSPQSVKDDNKLTTVTLGASTRPSRQHHSRCSTTFQ
eukprot:6193973-Pleurochrysis_carterae.AAC.5